MAFMGLPSMVELTWPPGVLTATRLSSLGRSSASFWRGNPPAALVTGFETAGPRVCGFGLGRRADAVAALAEGPLVTDRPPPPRSLHPESEALIEQETREAFTGVDGKRPAAWQLAWALQDQVRLFQTRASHSDDVTDVALANLRLASRTGAALSA